MVRFTGDDDLTTLELDGATAQGARFRLTDLTGARFDQSWLNDTVMRGADLRGADLDGWIDGLRVNGVEVAPLVEAELNRLFPGRENRRSGDPAEFLRSYDAAQAQWAAVVERATAMPELQDAHVDGEWSLSQTLRHLVLATDGWLRYGLLRLPEPFCPFGVLFTEWQERAGDIGVDVAATPSWDEVLAVRADRVAQVRAFLARMTPETMAEPAPGLPPWAEEDAGDRRRDLTVGRCLGVIGNEEWEHLRYAVRDLDALSAEGAP